MAAVKRVHLWLSGRVQGVFFRASTKEKAEALGLAGWVQNLPDGRVEAVFEGKQEPVNKMINWCKQGPRVSKVEKAEVKEEEPERLSGFAIIR